MHLCSVFLAATTLFSHTFKFNIDPTITAGQGIIITIVTNTNDATVVNFTLRIHPNLYPYPPSPSPHEDTFHLTILAGILIDSHSRLHHHLPPFSPTQRRASSAYYRLAILFFDKTGFSQCNRRSLFLRNTPRLAQFSLRLPWTPPL